MRGTEDSLYVISTHVMELYSHVYCTIKGVEEGKTYTSAGYKLLPMTMKF